MAKATSTVASDRQTGELMLNSGAMREQQLTFVSRILKSKVTEAAAVSISRTVKTTKSQCALLVLIFFGCYAGMLVGVRHMVDDTSQVNFLYQAIAVAGMCLCPCSTVMLSGWCASLALSPLPLIFSYKSEKSLCGAGEAQGLLDGSEDDDISEGRATTGYCTV